MKWNLEAVRKAISTIPEVVSVNAQDDSGDYATNSLFVIVGGTDENLWVRGFTTQEGGLKQFDDVEVEMVEVTTGYSDGDMPNIPELILAHAKIKVELVKLGFKVVNSMDRYF